MGGLRHQEQYSVSSYHMDMLQQVVHGSFLNQSLVRSYTRSFNGFAANLTYKEQEMLASFGEVVSIFPSRTLRTQTTRSWDFMGFHEDAERKHTTESDILVGHLDTGIWPESPSFNDEGLGPPPKKWRAGCKGGKNFTCNRKLIGARYYIGDSARDENGHGTHTASIAVGREVKNTSFYGLGKGTARGGVPSARVAAYKMCYDVCLEHNIMAAFDDAIADGVDIISVSVGFDDAVDVKYDSIAIGAFHAMQKGILTVQAAGNNGPKPGSIASVVPWVLAAGASTLDRTFVDRIGLGNGHVIRGNAIDTLKRRRKKFPLVYGKDIGSRCDENLALDCSEGCLNRSLVKNKIMVCRELADDTEAYQAGAAGIIEKMPASLPSSVIAFPESWITSQQFDELVNYINSSKHAGRTPKAYISTTKTVMDRYAPRAAGFSGRGPNSILPDILKPDVTAPGSTILAAYPPNIPPSENSDIDQRSVNYNILSGTSMSCPHVSGAAAYVKSFHPNWSPAAIKSALMTTASGFKKRRIVDAEFAYGAGQISPAEAVDPGLVYDSSTEDYIKLLCGLGYNTTALRQITGNSSSSSSSCPKAGEVETRHYDLNYPSMAAKVGAKKAFSVKFLRRVTNVGRPKSKYKVKIIKSSDIHVVVKPRILTFKAVNERKSFVVHVKGKIRGKKMVTASLEWSDGIHVVRSPIVVYGDSAFQ